MKTDQKKQGANLEDRVYDAGDMPPHGESYVYMPEGVYAEDIIDKAKRYWNEFRPKDVKQAITFAIAPGPYSLWKMPVEVHKSVNDILQHATEIIAAANPEAGIATGIVYGISQVVYGLKTRSGKHMSSGLVGIVEHAKKIKGPESDSLRTKIDVVLDYFRGFKPGYAT